MIKKIFVRTLITVVSSALASWILDVSLITIIDTVLSFLNGLLNYKIALKWYLIVTIIIVLIILIVMKLNSSNGSTHTNRNFRSYRTDSFDGLHYGWDYSGANQIYNITKLCECGCEVERYSGRNGNRYNFEAYRCPNCGKEFEFNKSNETISKLIAHRINSEEYLDRIPKR